MALFLGSQRLVFKIPFGIKDVALSLFEVEII